VNRELSRALPIAGLRVSAVRDYAGLPLLVLEGREHTPRLGVCYSLLMYHPRDT